MADVCSVSDSKRVHITGIEDEPNRSPADCATAQPDERAEAMRQLAEIEQIAGGERVEIPRQNVEAVLVPRDAREKVAQLDRPMPFGPGRVQGAQVQSEDSKLAWAWIDLQKRVTRQPRMMPLKVAHRATAHEGERLPF